MRVNPQANEGNVDRKAMEEYGIPGIVLMENAGIRLADEVLKLTGDGKTAWCRSPARK